MSESEQNNELPSSNDPELFLIEVPGEAGTRYFITEPIVAIDPQRTAMGVPWKDLSALFEGQTLRAVPVPGRIWRPRRRRSAGSAA